MTNVSFTLLGVQKSSGLHVSDDQFVALPLSDYYHIISSSFFFANPHPHPVLEEEEAIHMDILNACQRKKGTSRSCLPLPNFVSTVFTPMV